jgi:uncharacterized membrane protein YcjF (UPF0283 family)
MGYEFSWASFLFGVLILLAGAALVVWHRPIADTMASGVSSYERFKLWGLIACGVGLIVIFNLHTMVLRWLFGSLF